MSLRERLAAAAEAAHRRGYHSKPDPKCPLCVRTARFERVAKDWSGALYG